MFLSVTDYVIQALLLLVVFVYPSLLPEYRGKRAFGTPFLLVFVWGIWRVAIFDPDTSNDIPGMGYIVEAFVAGTIALILYRVRCAVGRWRARRQVNSISLDRHC